MKKILNEKKGFGEDYFLDLASRALHHLKRSPWEDEEKYDEIIIDEAQDLFNEGYKDILGHVLKGGLFDGYLRLFGDIEEQKVHRVKDFQSIFGQYNFTKFSLCTNYRNIEKVIDPLLKPLGTRQYKSYKRIGNEKAQIIKYDKEHIREEEEIPLKEWKRKTVNQLLMEKWCK